MASARVDPQRLRYWLEDRRAQFMRLDVRRRIILGAGLPLVLLLAILILAMWAGRAGDGGGSGADAGPPTAAGSLVRRFSSSDLAARFPDVRILPDSADAIVISGGIASEADREELRRALEEIDPGIALLWRVEVIPEDTLTPRPPRPPPAPPR